jgi:hypothetical protein
MLTIDQYKSMTVDEKVTTINNLLNKDATLSASKISTEMLGKYGDYVGSDLRRYGYYINQDTNQYALNMDRNIIKIQTNDKVDTSHYTTSVIQEVERFTKAYDLSSFTQQSIKVNKELKDRLDTFLKQYPYLQKQFIYSLALEMFLDKFE